MEQLHRELWRGNDTVINVGNPRVGMVTEVKKSSRFGVVMLAEHMKSRFRFRPADLMLSDFLFASNRRRYFLDIRLLRHQAGQGLERG